MRMMRSENYEKLKWLKNENDKIKNRMKWNEDEWIK